MTPEGPDPGGKPPPLWRRVSPFVIAAALVLYVASRIDLHAFVRALARVDYVGFIACALVFNVLVLSADALGAFYVYRRIVGPVRFGELLVIRGASYLPSMVNHHVGQAWLTYFVSRAYRTPMQRAVGATLLVYATTLGALLSFLYVAFAIGHGRLPWLTNVVIVATVAGAFYLALLAARPRFLADRPLLSPLFEAGIGGHFAAILFRLPHMLMQLFGAWVPLLFFGVKLPVPDALALLPVILFVVTLPLTAQGLGTREALSITLLSGYAVGTEAERAASIAAATVSWLVAILLIQLVVSLILMRSAHRFLGRASAS